MDIAKAHLFDDSESMHKKLIKLHTVHTNLQIDLAKIVDNLSTIPTFQTGRRRVILTWFRKSRPMIFGSLAGLLLCLTCATMLFIVIKLKLLLRLFGRLLIPFLKNEVTAHIYINQPSACSPLAP